MQEKNSPQSYTSRPLPGNPRKTEAWALTEAARRINEARTEPFDLEAFLTAIRLNWRLWTIFQAEMASPECPHSAEMRQNILSLANFIDKTSVEIISDPDGTKADILISINRELAAGLFADVPDAEGGSDNAPAVAPDAPIDSSV